MTIPRLAANALLIALFGALSTVLSAESPKGIRLTYEGRIAPAKEENPGEGEKIFQIELIVPSNATKVDEVYWTLQEEGQGGWPWLERFGIWSAGSSESSAATRPGAPALLYDRGDQGASSVTLEGLRIDAPRLLKKDVVWKTGKLRHQVVEREKKFDRPAWKVVIRDPYGIKRTLWLDHQTSAVTAGEETVFIGQGERFRLQFQLNKEQQLSSEQMKAVKSVFAQLAAVREQLKLKRPVREANLSGEQIVLLRRELPRLLERLSEKRLAKNSLPETAFGGMLERTIKTGLGDVQDQKSRGNAVAAMRKKIIGAPAPQFELAPLRGKTGLTNKQLAGKTTVLHFWTYHDTPLEEPYGQVGYLDFLARRYQDQGLQVLGVAVDPRLDDPDSRRKAIASVKKFQSFMNVSFPIFLDDQAALEHFGDPRPSGAKLPLFIVISPMGKVVHYHVGYYELSRDNGLEQLDQIVRKTLANGEKE